MEVKDLKAKLQYEYEKGNSPSNVAPTSTTKRELVAVIFDLFSDGVKDPVIDGVRLVPGVNGKTPMHVQSAGALARPWNALTVKADPPQMESEVIVNVAPRDQRLQVSVAWKDDSHPVVENQIYDDEISAGNSRDGEEFVISRAP